MSATSSIDILMLSQSTAEILEVTLLTLLKLLCTKTVLERTLFFELC